MTTQQTIRSEQSNDITLPLALVEQAIEAIAAGRNTNETLSALRTAMSQRPSTTGEAAKRWPFVETPGEFTERLRAALQENGGYLLGAVRYTLIESPPALATLPPQVEQSPQPYPVPQRERAEIIRKLHRNVTWVPGKPYIIQLEEIMNEAAALLESPAQPREPNITEDDYQHFLSYSGLKHDDLLRYAYFHGADVECVKPAAQPYLIKAVADVRDLFPIPVPGSPLESLWSQAMGDPESVPAYVKACIAAQPADHSELVKRLRLLESDHAPDGWPAIQMRDVSALLDALEGK